MGSFAAILLAGGQSRRMGRDKALLPFGPEPIAERLYGILAGCASDVVVVRDPHQGFPVAGARLIGDRHPGRGPLEGIATGLEHIACERAVVVACDMPFVDRAVIERLACLDPEADLVIPRTERGLEPLLAVYARRLAPAMRQVLEAGERRIQAILALSPAREVPARSLDPSGRAFWNLNHPEDYRSALASLDEGPCPPESPPPPSGRG